MAKAQSGVLTSIAWEWRWVDQQTLEKAAMGASNPMAKSNSLPRDLDHHVSA